MLVYTETISPRLQYIIDFAGRELGAEARLISDRDAYQLATGPKVNYSNTRIPGEELWIKPHGLLFEKNITPQLIECFLVNDQKAFFKTEGDHPFDIFAAAFFLLSRYEEYLPHSKDIYGRYAYQNSIAYREGFLYLPLVNHWFQQFKQKLKQKFLSFIPAGRSFRFLPTYDIDEAYAFKYKSWKRRAGATIKDLLKGNFTEIKLRRSVLKGKTPDPFDSYAWINDLHDRFKLQPRYFFLVADRTDKYDRNILPTEAALKTIIRQHANKYPIGVHPSWQSGDDIALIKKEKETVGQAAGIEIKSSRQHFIRFTLPQTFRYLIEAGIKEDFSMGYGSINGFRASVTTPFYWFDLEKNEATDLLLYPFCYMEANSFYEQRFTPLQALEEMKRFYREVKAVNGTLITIWHNTFLGTAKKFEGWREVYKEFLSGISGSEQANA